MFKDFFGRVIGSEKTGQHILIALLTVLTIVLMIWWGSGFDQAGKMQLISWLMWALGIMVPFGLGIEALQGYMTQKLGMVTEVTSTGTTQHTTTRPANMVEESAEYNGQIARTLKPAPVQQPVASAASSDAIYNGGD